MRLENDFIVFENPNLKVARNDFQELQGLSELFISGALTSSYPLPAEELTTEQVEGMDVIVLDDSTTENAFFIVDLILDENSHVQANLHRYEEDIYDASATVDLTELEESL